jgi:YVTN family beta-propeller protein
VSKVDLVTRSIVKTISFPSGTRPWMLRVSPDGKALWVQTGTGNTNVVLDPETLDILQTTPAGKQPVVAAFQPNGGPYGLVTHADDTFVLVLDRDSGQAVTRIEVGQSQSNTSFSADGALAFVSVTGANELAVIDMANLAVVARIPTGPAPMGLVLLDATGP